MTRKKALSSKVDLNLLLSGSGLSDAVAAHLFGASAPDVEVEVLDARDGDDVAAIRALHASIERMLECSSNVAGVSVFAPRYRAFLAETLRRLSRVAPADDAKNP
jgi:ribonuclease PH